MVKAISLFAGIGGFDLALERNGHTVTDQVEIDTHARKTLARHFPDSRLHEDIHDFSGLHMETSDRQTRTRPTPTGASFPSGRGRWGDERHATDGIDSGGERRNGRASTDIVVGGFPCQDYSVAGSRGGLAGDRGALWWQMHRVIDESRPTWVIGENVPGLVSSADGRDFRTIIDSLVGLGYGVCWRILDAQYFGVAQRRRRVFIVGHSGGEPRPEVLALGQGSIGDSPPSRPTRKGAAVAVAGRPELSSTVAGTLGSLNGGARTTDIDGNGAYVVGPLTAGMGKGPRGTEAVQSNHLVAFAQNQRDEVRMMEVEGALAAEPGMKQQTYISIPTVRRLTPLECERLQGFPDGWTEGNSDTQRYRQLGNAVAVPVVEWIIGNLTRSHEEGQL